MAAASSAAATAAAANPPTTLLTWGGGDTGLTSFDPFCLTVQVRAAAARQPPCRGAHAR